MAVMASESEVEKIIKDSVFLTHGGNLASLYVILATGSISSVDHLKNQGHFVYKYTDPENKFTEEDSKIFFESPVDRGRFSYATLSSKSDSPHENPGFAFS